MKRYIRSATDVYTISYLVPKAVAATFRNYLDTMSGFDTVQYDVTITPDDMYQFDCNLTFNVEFGINSKIAQLGYKKVKVNDSTWQLV